MKVLILLLLFSISTINSFAVSTVILNEKGHIEEVNVATTKKEEITETQGFEGFEFTNFDKRIFGDFTRDQILDASEFPNRVIGQLDRICTGTLISSRHVLTAAHCVYDFDAKEWIDRNTFSPARIGAKDSPYGTKDWKKIYILKDYLEKGNTESDFAVVELNEALGDQIGWLGFGYRNSDKDGKPGFITGYPGDKDSGTMWSVECPLRFYKKELEHRCDTYGGMSGAAIRTLNDQGEEVIIGIHTYGGIQENGGVRINKEIFNIIYSWTKGNGVQNSLSRMNPNDNSSYDKIIYKNDCHITIWTAIHYKNLNDQWVTEGWWNLAPGETAYVAGTRNRVYYIHAQSADGKIHWGSDDYSWDVKGNGKQAFLAKEITTNSWGTWTQGFSCN